MNKNFTLHCDSGHGWLEVSQSDLDNAGLNTSHFSAYSYVDGKTLYLEEDSDASIFIQAFTAKHGAPVFAENYIDAPMWSPIRNMSRVSNK